MIAGRLPGRTDNEIKNYWNTHIRRKLLNRGIDPATHRPLNESAQETTTTTTTTTNTTTTISFAASATPKEEEKTTSGFVSNDMVINPVQEQCPDLNLELRISPPYQPQQQPDQLKSGGRGSLCFSCSLGLQNSKDCSCGIASIDSNSASSSVGYDFLGVKSGVLDYRSLEMK